MHSDDFSNFLFFKMSLKELQNQLENRIFS